MLLHMKLRLPVTQVHPNATIILRLQPTKHGDESATLNKSGHARICLKSVHFMWHVWWHGRRSSGEAVADPAEAIPDRGPDRIEKVIP